MSLLAAPQRSPGTGGDRVIIHTSVDGEVNQHTTNHQVAQLPPPIRDIPPSGWCPISVSQSGSQFGWFGGASRGTPELKVPNEILKVKMGVHHTRTFLLI